MTEDTTTTTDTTTTEEAQSLLDLLGITPLSIATTLIGLIVSFIGIFFIDF